MINSNNPIILVEKTAEDAKKPIRSESSASGADVCVQKVVKVYDPLNKEQSIERYEILYSCETKVEDMKAGWWIYPGHRYLIDTGLRVAIGIPGYEIQVRSRSGLAFKLGLRVENSPGTIDCDYRGMLGIILINDSKATYTIYKHDRIAQIVAAKVELLGFKEVEKLPDSHDRGTGGFGHTGV